MYEESTMECLLILETEGITKEINNTQNGLKTSVNIHLHRNLQNGAILLIIIRKAYDSHSPHSKTHTSSS